MLAAGTLDRRVTILVKTETRDPVYNTPVYSWEPLATVWAQVQDVLPSRAYAQAGELALTKRPARVRMRWRDDVTQENRVEIDGRQMRIVSGPAMLGRREGLEIMVEELSTEGQQA
jgi:SPP1 family predicted phage head-tail adaptor